MMRDLFGNEVTEEEARAMLKNARKTTRPNGYAAPPGTGPKGETCGTCKHLARIQLAKVYRKCRRMESQWTGGPGTDVLAKSPACKRWEAA